MLSAISPRSLLRFELTIPKRPPPRIDGTLRGWDDACRVPDLGLLDGQQPFASWWWSWSDAGLAFALHVADKTRPFRCDPERWWKGDGVRICIDTRDTRDLRRATRFCHFYYALPAGGGRGGKAPVVGLHRMSRAREHPPGVDPAAVLVAVERARGGYGLEVLLPAAGLHGWNPADQPRIGVFLKVRDAQHGGQNLSCADDAGWNSDPSTWASARLTA